MARLLILSSQVAAGHVGASAGAPAAMALGHEVFQLPTVVLSNHPGFAAVAAHQVPPDVLGAMLDAIGANGWLSGLNAVLTGYLPTATHVDVACRVVDTCRTEGAPRVVVDPILGDAPKGLYLDRGAAEAIRDRLVPRADVLTPNLFELGWLTGRPVDTLAEALAAARGLRGARGAPKVLVTSAPVRPSETGVLDAADPSALYTTERQVGVPHGTGDVLAALVAAGASLGQAVGHLDRLIRASLHAPHLRIAQAVADWTAAAPVPGTPLPEEDRPWRSTSS